MDEVRGCHGGRPARWAAGAALVLVLTSWGCAGTSDFAPGQRLAPVMDAPPRFEPQQAELRLAQGDTLAGRGCVSPLVDPRDGTILRMVRSAETLGDYEAPRERYGTGTEYLIRVVCNTGAPAGLAPR